MNNNPYEVSEGLPTAPGKFVIRLNGNLVRGDGGKPLLFETVAEAAKMVEALQKETSDG